MRFHIWTGAMCAFLAVSGCSTFQGWTEDAYVVRTASPDAITLEFRQGNLNIATERAEAHCKDSGRSATLANVTTTGDRSVATFNCRY